MFQEHEGRKTLSELDRTRSIQAASDSGDRPNLGTAPTCPLEHILGLLEVLRLEIDQFMRVHGRPDDRDDDSALSWMQTAVEDMSATLVGVSSQPQHGNEA